MRSLKERGREAMPSPPASRLSVLAAALAMLVAALTGCTTTPPPPASVAVAGDVDVDVDADADPQALAVLLESQVVMSAPDERAAALQVVEGRRPITVERTVLPIIGQRSEKGGVRWLRVLLPGRPNGHTGWIRQRATVSALTRWHIVVDTSERRVSVYKQGRRVRVFKAVVGKPATPTPHGKFFVEEVVQLQASDVGAPFALALSARSNVLQEYNGGPGQIAVHGLLNVGGVLGTAASHGCVRLANEAMRWLVVRIKPGVPVTIKV
jgi:lipoprotein-anchoring transpeptidase ErfK/SrfK